MKMKKSLALLSAVLCFSNAGVSQVDGFIGVSIDWMSLDKSKNILGKGVTTESLRFKRASSALYNVIFGFLYNCGNGLRVGPDFSYGFANKKSRLDGSDKCQDGAVALAGDLIGEEIVFPKMGEADAAKLAARITNTDNYSRKIRSVGTIGVKIGGNLNTDVALFVHLGYTFANVKVRALVPTVTTASGSITVVEASDLVLATVLNKNLNKAAKPKKHGFSFGLEGAVKVAPNCSISARAMYATSIKLWRVGVAVSANF